MKSWCLLCISSIPLSSPQKKGKIRRLLSPYPSIRRKRGGERREGRRNGSRSPMRRATCLSAREEEEGEKGRNKKKENGNATPTLSYTPSNPFEKKKKGRRGREEKSRYLAGRPISTSQRKKKKKEGGKKEKKREE